MDHRNDIDSKTGFSDRNVGMALSVVLLTRPGNSHAPCL